MAEDPGRPDLGFKRRVHVIGAGGAGMSAISIVLRAMGHDVTGTDLVASNVLERLAAVGVTVHVGHDPGWLGAADVVVKSTAIPDANPEVAEAHRRGLTIWRRSEILAAICAQKRVAAVAGTHGKTTTSSLLYLVLREGGLHPSMIIGGDIVGVGPGAAWDEEGEWLVVEADESDGTFLQLGAEVSIVTSVEPDHLDFYGDEAGMRSAFARFVAATPGPVVISADDEGAQALASAGDRIGGRVLSYGLADTADVRAVDVSQDGIAARFAVATGGDRVASVSLAAPGLYNVRNATAALTLGHAIGVPWRVGAAALGRFQGVARRFEVRGERDGVVYVDDYAHLPGEVAPALAAAQAGPWERVVAVFQPHRFSRTAALWRDFADAFTLADILLVTDIYPAGEAARPGVSGELVFNAVHQKHPDADVRYVPRLDDVASELRRLLRPGDLCLTLGAGDLTALPSRMLLHDGGR